MRQIQRRHFSHLKRNGERALSALTHLDQIHDGFLYQCDGFLYQCGNARPAPLPPSTDCADARTIIRRLMAMGTVTIIRCTNGARRVRWLIIKIPILHSICNPSVSGALRLYGNIIFHGKYCSCDNVKKWKNNFQKQKKETKATTSDNSRGAN